MIRQSNSFQQSIALSKPDKKAEVRGPGDVAQTLVLDGKVDAFIGSDSNLTFQSLKDVAKLVNSVEFQERLDESRKGRPWVPHWTQLRGDFQVGGPERFLEDREGALHIDAGLQKVRISGDDVALKTDFQGYRDRSDYQGSHLIEGRRNWKHGFDCTGETYNISSSSGNAPISAKDMWSSAARKLENLF